MSWWAVIGSFFSKVLSTLISYWLVWRGAKKEAVLEKTLEVSREDRENANEIRDRVSTVKPPTKLYDNKPTDKRGYRD